MEPETTICLALAVRRLPSGWKIPEDWDITGKTGAYVHFHREDFVQTGINKGFSHLLMVDADLIFPADAIDRLIAKKADVAYATYNRKNRPYEERLPDTGGFMLIDLEAVKKIEMPRFRCEYPTGEDIDFLQKARAAGLKVVRDDEIVSGHIGKKVY